MRLGPIVLKLRLAQTRFGNRVGGTAELDLAKKYTLTKEMSFVVPIMEVCKENEYDSGINQEIKEQFGVIVAITNDTYQQDKSGLLAYDQIHDTRTEIWDALLGWEVSWSESLIYYMGGSIIFIDSAYLWYMFKFEYRSRILSKSGFASLPGAELILRDVAGINTVEEGDPNNPVSPMHPSRRSRTGVDNKGRIDISLLPTFDRMYVQYIKGKDVRLYDGSLGDIPFPDGYPDVTLPDQAQWLDMTANPNAGEFWRAFATAFDKYKF